MEVRYNGYHIVCVGVNPAFDVTLRVKILESQLVCRVYKEKTSAAGKALNVCAQLRRLGADAEYICFLGDKNSDIYTGELETRGIPYRSVLCSGRTRENLTLLVDRGSREYKINRNGFSVSPSDIERLKAHITDSLTENAGKKIIAVFSGSMPEGMTTSQYFELMLFAGSKGMLVAVDTDALWREQIEPLYPWLYKPNENELKQLYDIDEKNGMRPEDLALLAVDLCRNGVENVLLTLGEKGLYLVDKEGARLNKWLFIEASEKRLTNTTGAGDRTLAGYIAAYCMGMDKEESARIAARCGEDEEEKLTADCLNGTGPM